MATELACQHGGYLGLIDAQEFRSGGLRQAPLADGPVDPKDQAGLEQMVGGVGQAEVRKDVARAGFLLFQKFSSFHPYSSPRPRR